MISFPNAKINLGLNVVEKRTDGYHNIETIFYPVDLCDILEIIPASDGRTEFRSTGLPIPGDPERNLCLQAYHLLCRDFDLTPVKIHLHKLIPTGAGLGGGSSDGAQTLILLNEIFRLDLSTETRMDYARSLGSDCAFFLKNSPVYAHGRGDLFEDIAVDLSRFRIVIVVPDVHADTAASYKLINPSVPEYPVTKGIKLPVQKWKNQLFNDFELPFSRRFPVVREIKEYLYNRGAIYASLSGSGSAIYAISDKQSFDIPSFPGCFIWSSG